MANNGMKTVSENNRQIKNWQKDRTKEEERKAATWDKIFIKQVTSR